MLIKFVTHYKREPRLNSCVLYFKTLQDSKFGYWNRNQTISNNRFIVGRLPEGSGRFLPASTPILVFLRTRFEWRIFYHLFVWGSNLKGSWLGSSVWPSMTLPSIHPVYRHRTSTPAEVIAFKKRSPQIFLRRENVSRQKLELQLRCP